MPLLKDLIQESAATALAHGFTCENVPEQIALMHSELSEALEAHRCPKNYESVEAQQANFREELADVVIRVMSFCGLNNIDLEGAILAKMAKNRTRSRMHGGKLY